MKKVRVTVLKKEFYPDLAAEYGSQTMKPCPFFEVGQVYECKENKRPEGFALSSGGTDIYDGRWLKAGSNTCINCCNDGMRPVVFKLEVIE